MAGSLVYIMSTDADHMVCFRSSDEQIKGKCGSRWGGLEVTKAHRSTWEKQIGLCYSIMKKNGRELLYTNANTRKCDFNIKFLLLLLLAQAALEEI